MKKGDILELEITSSGMEGEGVARHDGVVVFVPRALVGEKVRVMVKEVRSRFARAGVIKLIQQSPHRVKPVCPVFYKCGSCDMQHIDYGEQLRVKRASVASCLAKACGREIDVDEVVPSPHIVGYRNKIQAPLGVVDGKLVAGYFAEGTHRVVPFPDGGCAMYDKDMSRLLDVFLTFARERGLTCYDESTRKGLLRHFVARRVGDAYAIVVVINGAKLPHADQLIAAIKREKAKFSLFTCSNTAPTNVILHGKLTRLWGEESLPCNVLGVKAQVGPLSFMQINDEVRDLIYSAAALQAAALDNATVIDAYSGTGMLTNILAKHASRVVGIEIVPEAVADADALTAMNGNEGKVRNICGDCAEVLPREVAALAAQNTPSVVVLDPPRKGCDKKVVDALLSAAPDKIVYISCNPATLARDVALLMQKYDITSVTPYDMFPQTKHVETLVCFQAKQS